MNKDIKTPKRHLLELLGDAPQWQKERALAEIEFRARSLLSKPVIRNSIIRRKLEATHRKIVTAYEAVASLPDEILVYLGEDDPNGTDEEMKAIEQRFNEAVKVVPSDPGGPTPLVNFGPFVIAAQWIFESTTGSRATYWIDSNTGKPGSKFWFFLSTAVEIYWPHKSKIPLSSLRRDVRLAVGIVLDESAAVDPLTPPEKSTG